MTGSIVLNPIAPLWMIVILGLAAFGVALFATLRGSRGGPLRILAAMLFTALLCDPQFRREQRTPLPDVALIVADRSASQRLDRRETAADATLADLRGKLGAFPGMETVETVVAGDEETRLGDGIENALTEAPRGRLSAVFVVTDGQASDAAALQRLAPEAPVHVLLTGRRDEKDRKITLVSAPRYGVVRETAKVAFRVDDLGPDEKPLGVRGRAAVSLRIDGKEALRETVPLGEVVSFEAPIEHPGRLIIELAAEPLEGELTAINNAAVLDITAIRDRLRVLLISGAPHPGERVWRNLLKSDPSVDLVHFTILRPIEKSDPFEQQDELALIPFPQDELFNEKLGAFDLVIFDRYDFPGVLNLLNFMNIAQYVRDGGAVLVATGPEFSGVRALGGEGNFAQILPAEPLGGAREEPFRPRITETGRRHPVTDDLPEPDIWGRWIRLTPASRRSGRALMSGPDSAPLLVLDRVAKGRVGLLLSDHVWLWARGFDGGGPHAELLRRVAHWLMREPELEEEQLALAEQGSDLVVRRVTLSDDPGPVEIEKPDGTTTQARLAPIAPGRFEARIDDAARGLYRARSGDLFAVGAMGLAAPPEFQSVVSDRTKIRPLAEKTGGGIFNVRRPGAPAAAPSLRKVGSEGGPKAGAAWAGLVARNAYRTEQVEQQPVAPAWVWLFLSIACLAGAWAFESARRR
jgi:hypothetical protein